MNTDFNFNLVGWVRCVSNKIFYTKNKIPFVWISIKTKGSDKLVLLNIFNDKIDINLVKKFKMGNLLKISGFIIFNGKFNNYYLVPTEIKKIASKAVEEKEFNNLDTLVEKEKILKNQDNEEIVELNWNE